MWPGDDAYIAWSSNPKEVIKYRIILSSILILGIGFAIYMEKQKSLQQQVQQGFIPKNNLEIRTIDLDKTDRKGIPETYIQIDETLYELRYDEQQRPTISQNFKK